MNNLVLKSVLLLFLMVGCTVGISSGKPTSVSTSTTADTTETQTLTTVTSQDGVVQLTLPNNWHSIWTEADKEQWSLLVAERSQFTQLGIRSIAKADYPTLTSELHTQAALAAGTAPFTDPEIVEQGQTITVNGHPAVQYQVRGTTSGQRLVAVSLSVETADYYHGVLVISPEANFASQQAELNRIIQSLQEIQSTASAQ